MQLELFTTLNNKFVYLNQTIMDTTEYDEMCDLEDQLWEQVKYYGECENEH